MHKDDKGEFEYVPAKREDCRKLSAELYKKIYTQKQIDWSKVDKTVPVRGVRWPSTRASALYSGDMRDPINVGEPLILDTTILLANPGHCPLPEGVMIEVVFRGGIDFSGPIAASELNWDIGELYPEEEDLIISTYRITGLADGWKH